MSNPISDPGLTKEQLEDRLKTYEAALHFYADHRNYEDGDNEEIPGFSEADVNDDAVWTADNGYTARAALGTQDDYEFKHYDEKQLPATVRAAILTALSVPENKSGVEKAVEVRPISADDLIVEVPDDAGGNAPAQLSDEDRGRLELIATRIGGEFDVEMPPHAEARADMAFLRKLASQQGRDAAVPVVRAELGEERIDFELECGHIVGLSRADVASFNSRDELELPTELVCPACIAAGQQHGEVEEDARG